jgi:Flp pilus assembly pilin Flp
MVASVLRFLSRDADAATAVEYAVMLALVFLAVLGAVLVLGQNTSQSWSYSNTQLKAVNFGS